jgi:hypothetical protein
MATTIRYQRPNPWGSPPEKSFATPGTDSTLGSVAVSSEIHTPARLDHCGRQLLSVRAGLHNLHGWSSNPFHGAGPCSSSMTARPHTSLGPRASSRDYGTPGNTCSQSRSWRGPAVSPARAFSLPPFRLAPGRFFGDRTRMIQCGVVKRHHAWLITRRTEVRILPPLVLWAR